MSRDFISLFLYAKDEARIIRPPAEEMEEQKRAFHTVAIMKHRAHEEIYDTHEAGYLHAESIVRHAGRIKTSHEIGQGSLRLQGEQFGQEKNHLR